MHLNENKLITFLDKMQREDQLIKLIRQINKDANLSGIDFRIDEESSALHIVQKLSKLVKDLITNNYDSYLNFLYRIDISEKETINMEMLDITDQSKKITFLILKREWQKVWFKNRIQ